MTSPNRALLVEAARETIARGSKSFRFASRLFDRETRERAWLLYAWCRACDDIADGQTLGHVATKVADPEARLEHLRRQTARALAGEATGELPFEALAVVANECGIPRRFIDDHLDGFAMDARGWRPDAEADMLAYCYHVAGAVGCMMAVLMGVPPEDEETLDRASDLGIAFQLANIARDIGDDHGIGRCYLPAEWLEAAGIARNGQMEERGKLASIGQRLADLAERYEASARVGARRLPFRSRWAVLAAANIYGGIAQEVARRGASAWDRRVVIDKAEKLGHVVAAWREARSEAPLSAGRDELWTRPRRS